MPPLDPPSIPPSRRVFEVFFLSLILVASGRLWWLQTLRLPCAAACRRGGARALATSGRHLRLRLWLLQTLRLPGAAAGRRGGARALATSGGHLLLRLWLLLMLRHGWGCGLLPCYPH